MATAETPTQKARRYKNALEGVSRLGDGVPMYIAGAIIDYVLDEGMTFRQAKAAYDRDARERSDEADRLERERIARLRRMAGGQTHG